MFGVFRVKNHDFMQTNLIISNCGGRLENFWGISCEKSRLYAKKSDFFQRAAPRWIRPCLGCYVVKRRTDTVRVVLTYGPTSPRLRADLASLTGRLVSVPVVRGPSYLVSISTSHRSHTITEKQLALTPHNSISEFYLAQISNYCQC